MNTNTYTPGTKFAFSSDDARATDSEGGPWMVQNFDGTITAHENILAHIVADGWAYVRPLGRGWHLMTGEIDTFLGDRETVYCKVTTRTLNHKAERIG